MDEKIPPPKWLIKKIPVGLSALISEFALQIPPPAVHCFCAAAIRSTIIHADGQVIESYPMRYQPTDIIGHLRFALRYEPIELGAIQALFRVLDPHLLEEWVRDDASSKFARRAWYLYELLTGKTLDVPDISPTTYVDLLNHQIQFTAEPKPSRRQRINDNLLGGAEYCPMIRRTPRLESWLAQDLSTEAKTLVRDYDPALMARAVNYLFTKETKSSFAIEGETPSPDRATRFVAALAHADRFDSTDPQEFVRLQNIIVDQRYAQNGWRSTQNYVGQTMRDYSQDVHFICPKPEDVPGLMQGWMKMMPRLAIDVDPVIAAAAASFGFVFIHPFEDGNGRIHRFLIHHVLSRSEFSPAGLIFPVSEVMLRNRRAYDLVLDGYSSSILPYIDWTMDPDQTMTVRNETAALYRYFDATSFAEYLYSCVADTIRIDLREELSFLVLFDAAHKRTLNIVDMPDRRAALLIRLILQNSGKLSAAKRNQFAELTDAEINAIEAAIAELQSNS